MTIFYFPGCKYSARSPESSARLTAYLAGRFGAVAAGCCSADHARPERGDATLYQCPTCGLILNESGTAGTVRSVFELLLEDERFPWPDCGGEAMTVQDCWRSRKNAAFCDAVRECLRRMNVTIVELEQRYERADFCGPSLYKGPNPRYSKLAPQSLVNEWTHPVLSEDEQRARVLEHARDWTTEKVLVTCIGCAQGVEMAGHTPVHLLDLLTAALPEAQGGAR
ncbi:MAG: hypothetical protein J6H20_06985 [Pyramidobacter sp.]|nr:hypothetical protein [Pyramidobacter sp.]